MTDNQQHAFVKDYFPNKWLYTQPQIVILKQMDCDFLTD
jgi:hypothetical protein